MTSSREVHVLFFKSSLSHSLSLSPPYPSRSLEKFYSPLSFRLASLSPAAQHISSSALVCGKGARNLFYVRMGAIVRLTIYSAILFDDILVFWGKFNFAALPFLRFPLDYITKKFPLSFSSLILFSLFLRYFGRLGEQEE
jgi:hypothetical protein